MFPFIETYLNLVVIRLVYSDKMLTLNHDVGTKLRVVDQHSAECQRLVFGFLKNSPVYFGKKNN